MVKVLPTDSDYPATDFVGTYTGRSVFPLDPKIEQITIIDIAHHLSQQCRYAGASVQHYSTAQHCCILADYVENSRLGSPSDCLQMLLHDAAEAYLVDVPRPVKQHMADYRLWDFILTKCIRHWAGLGELPIPDWQDELDSRICRDEKDQLLTQQEHAWTTDTLEPLGLIIEPWSIQRAEQEFLVRYANYSKAVFGSSQYLRSAWGVATNSRYTPDFRTRGSDTAQRGPTEPFTVTDLLEVDIRGGCGRITLRTPDGMMARDPQAGLYPRPAWEFIHGNFELLEVGA